MADVASGVLAWLFYATVVGVLRAADRAVALALPERALAPFRIANPYGLFATMTEARYEIEFQGSRRRRRDVDRRIRSATSRRIRIERPGHLRAVSAALRVESLVRVARHRGRSRRGSCSRSSGCSREARACSRCSGAIRSTASRQRRCARCSGSTGSPIRGKARDGRVVAAAIARPLRRHGEPGQHRSRRVH